MKRNYCIYEREQPMTLRFIIPFTKIKIYHTSFFIYSSERQLDEVIIGLVGKYTALEDAYASVLKALNHAALFCNRKLKVLVR
jgi:CTP synthase